MNKVSKDCENCGIKQKSREAGLLRDGCLGGAWKFLLYMGAKPSGEAPTSRGLRAR